MKALSKSIGQSSDWAAESNGGVITGSTTFTSRLSLAGLWEGRNRTRVLLLSSALLAGIAFVDWRTESYFSLGFLYLFPIMLTARFMPRWAIVLVALCCAGLSQLFSSLDPSDALIRFSFEALALAGCGLFVAELIRNRKLAQDAEERLRVLVETSPAAIVTVDERGFIERANHAAAELLIPPGGSLRGQPIAAFIPELHHALRKEDGPQFRTSMQCRGHRGSGESFLAEVWFSTYREGVAPKLAAIIADVTEERMAAHPNSSLGAAADRATLNGREVGVLRLLVQGVANKEIASTIGLSESAVKNTLQQLFAKSEVRTRSQLVRVALEQYRDLL